MKHAFGLRENKPNQTQFQRQKNAAALDDVFGLMDLVACELPDKKNFLIVQGNFDKSIDVVE